MKALLQKEAFIKSVIWRLAISIPVGVAVNYFILGKMYESLILSGIMNVLGFFLYYSFEVLWPRIWEKIKNSPIS